MSDLARALGRRPPTNKPALMLAPSLTGIIVPPTSADHFARVPSWILGGNDKYGDCGPVSVANQRLLVTTYLTSTPQKASQADIFDLYKRSGNPAFDPNDPGGPGDGGVDMQTMLEALVATGIGGEKALAFAKVDVGSLDELRAAIAIFGSLLLGVDLDTAQQTGTLWDYKPSPVWGGHAIVSGRYREVPDRMAVVSWDEVIDMTDTFLGHQLGEAWVVVWPEHLTSAVFLAGIDLMTLAADYTTLTGRLFPVPIPAPTDPDAAFAAVLRPWVAVRHTGTNRTTAAAAKAWLTAKSLE